MNVEICSQHTMPVYKMSMGVFLLDQCPMWAKFAAVDHDGIACWFSEKPVLGYDNRWQSRGRSWQYRAIESDVRVVDRAVLDRYLYRKGSYAAFDHSYRRIESAGMLLNDRVVRGQLAHKFLSYEIMHSNVEADHEMFPHVSVASDIHSYRQEGKPIPEYLKPKLAFIA